MGSVLFQIAVAASTLVLSLVPAQPGEPNLFAGPVRVRVLDVLDGDTFAAEALVWPGHIVRVNVRIRGIDTPEMKARCPAERLAAARARDALAELLRADVSISNIGSAKYYGRVLADVTTGDGAAVAEAMIGRALARPYEGGKRQGWCG